MAKKTKTRKKSKKSKRVHVMDLMTISVHGHFRRLEGGVVWVKAHNRKIVKMAQG